MSAPYTVLDKPLEDYAMLCRSCLTESGQMKNIFEWGLADDFCSVTNIQVSRAECTSELLCVVCEDMLVTCKQFQQQCLHSDQLLRNTVKKKSPSEPTTEEDLPTQTKENTISSTLHDNKLTIKITAPDMEAKIYLPCIYCNSSFIKQKDLLLHLGKTHQIKNGDITIHIQYYCSFISCSYNVNSGKDKFFQGRKYLNQHFTKVHMSKVFNCDMCSTSFATSSEFNRHLKTCNVPYLCDVCNIKYKTNERLLVHLMRKHPDLHRRYKKRTKSLKRKSENEAEAKKIRVDEKLDCDRRFCDEFRRFCDSPKRSFATQTLIPEENIKNDVTLPSWQTSSKGDTYETKTDEISTQTVFEDLLSLKSQTSEDESIFFSETVSLSDIQTQTFPLEFGLSRSNKETITCETQSPDLSIKETQTCLCLYDSPKSNFNRLFDSISSSPGSINLTSTETQTAELRSSVKSDVLLSFSSAETQTSFEDGIGKDSL